MAAESERDIVSMDVLDAGACWRLLEAVPARRRQAPVNRGRRA